MRYSVILRKACLFPLTFLVAVNFSSCSADEEDVNPVDDLSISAKSQPSNIYIAGTGSNGQGRPFPTYWVNGIATTLSATYSNATVYRGDAFGMALSKKDVYVCGVLYTSRSSVGAYWKNGEPVFLHGNVPQPIGIAVLKKDVYVAGVVSGGDGYNVAVVWKNGVISYLTGPDIPSTAEAIAVSGKDVYVGGNVVMDGKTYGAYWKNGNAVLLNSGEGYVLIMSLAVAGSDVYAAGIDAGSNVGRYWKNGEPVNLTDGASKVDVFAVCVNGADVYAAGRRRGLNSYEMLVWKNGELIIVSPRDAYDLDINDIAVDGDEILVTGSEIFIREDSSIFSNALLWRNGVAEVLDKGSDGENVYFAHEVVFGKK